MGRSSLPKYTGNDQSSITYFDVSSQPYVSDNSSYDHPTSSRSYGSNSYRTRALNYDQSRLFKQLNNPYNQPNSNPSRLDDKIKPYISISSASSIVCPTCQRPFDSSDRINRIRYMDVTRQKRAA